MEDTMPAAAVPGPQLVRPAASAPVHALSFLGTRNLWILCGLICLSRLLLIPFAHYLQGDDGPRYLREGVNLHTSGVFSSLEQPPPTPTAHDLPLYPLLLSALLALFHGLPATEEAASVLNALFFTLAAAGLYGLALRLSGRVSIGLIAATVFSLFPETWPYAVFYEPDSLFTAMFIWAVLFLLLFLQSGAKAWFFSAAGLLGIAILVKPIAEFYWPVLAVAAFFFWPGKQRPAARIAWLAAGLLLQAAIVSPWILRNYLAFGSPVLSSITGINLFRENYRLMLEDMDPSHARTLQDNQLAAATAAAGPSWNNPVVESQALGAIASREIRAHWPSYLAMTLKRHPRLYLGTGSVALVRLFGDTAGVEALEAWQSHPSLSGARRLPVPVLLLQTSSWLVLSLAYLAAAAGAIALARLRKWLPLAIALSALVYFAAVIGPLTITRYRLPMAPFFSLLAAYGIWEGLGHFRSRHPLNTPLS